MRFLTPAELRGLDSRALEELLGRTELLVAAGSERISGIGAAALMFADYAVVDSAARLVIDEAWPAVKWRLGRKALRLLLDGKTEFSAAEAVEAGLCDERIEGDPGAWLERWMRHRSTTALETAAVLIRARGGDALERAAFARLFAIGEPQKGLAAFLDKKKPDF